MCRVSNGSTSPLRRVPLALALGAVLWGTVPAVADLVLARDGTTDYRIVVATDVDVSTRAVVGEAVEFREGCQSQMSLFPIRDLSLFNCHWIEHPMPSIPLRHKESSA